MRVYEKGKLEFRNSETANQRRAETRSVERRNVVGLVMCCCRSMCSQIA